MADNILGWLFIAVIVFVIITDGFTVSGEKRKLYGDRRKNIRRRS